MKIALLSHRSSPQAPTGAERVLGLLARGLHDRGHSVVVSAPRRCGLEVELERAGIEVRAIPVRCCWLVQADRQPLWLQSARAARYLFPDPGARDLRRFLSELNPDVVHVNCLPHLRGAAAARACGLPVVWHVHEILPPGARRRWFAKRLQRDASRIVAVSEAVAGWLRVEGLADRVEVILNGVDPPPVVPDPGPARASFGLSEGVFTVGLFSQLVEHKGALHFIRAAHAAAAERHGLRFLIAGHGPKDFVARLQAAAENGPAASRIQVLPPQDEIWPLLAAVDVVAITTLWPDPLPRIVMEAMAVGKPIVGYDGGGVPEMVVDGQTGLLVPTGDVEALARSWLRLAGDPAMTRALSEQAARRARALFSVAVHVDRLEEALRSCARPGGQRL